MSVLGLHGHHPMLTARHHPLAVALVAVAMAVAGGGTWFGLRWVNSGAHELSTAQALQRFGSGRGAGAGGAPGTRPAQGVYQYAGSGTEHVSRPPKTQYEGPGMPGTVTYQADGCWTFRLDYSDNHWQSSTYCRSGGALVNQERSGWYRWDFVIVVVQDTATYTCSQASMSVPVDPRAGQRYPLHCTGTNDNLDTGPVTLKGYSEVVGTTTVEVGGQAVPAVHMREVTTMSGGQTGTNTADTWFAAGDGLPLRGSWTTDVSTPSPLGTSTMTAGGSWSLQSLTPQS